MLKHKTNLVAPPTAKKVKIEEKDEEDDEDEDDNSQSSEDHNQHVAESMESVSAYLDDISQNPTAKIKIDVSHMPDLTFSESFLQKQPHIYRAAYDFAATHAAYEAFIEFEVSNQEKNPKSTVSFFVDIGALTNYIRWFLFSFESFPLRSAVTTHRDLPYFMISIYFIIEASTMLKQFPRMLKPEGFSLIVNDAQECVYARAACAFYDFGQMLSHPKRFPMFTREVVFFSLLMLCADHLFMTKDQVANIAAFVDIHELFGARFIMQRTVLMHTILNVKTEPPEIKATDMINEIIALSSRFCVNPSLASFANPFDESSPAPWIDIQRAVVYEPVIAHPTDHRDLTAKRKMLQALHTVVGKEEEVVISTMKTLDAVIPVHDDPQSSPGSKKKRALSEEEKKDAETLKMIEADRRFDKFYMLVIKTSLSMNPRTESMPPALLKMLKKYSPTADEEAATLFFNSAQLTPISQKSAYRHVVFKTATALSMGNNLDPRVGHMCFMYGYLAKAFVSSVGGSETWKDVLGYLTFVYTGDFAVAQAMMTMLDNNKEPFMRDFFLVIADVLYDVFLATAEGLEFCPVVRMPLMIKLLLLLVPGIHTRVKNPSELPNGKVLQPTVDGIIDIVVLGAGEDVCKAAFDLVMRPEGSTEIVGTTLILNSIMLWLKSVSHNSKIPLLQKPAKTQSMRAKQIIFFFDVLEMFEMSVGGFIGARPIMLTPEPPRPNIYLTASLDTVDRNSIPCIYGRKKQPEVHKKTWSRYPYEMDVVEPETIVTKHLQSFAVILAYAEQHRTIIQVHNNNNNVHNHLPFHKFWFNHMHVESRCHSKIMESLVFPATHDYIYPLYRLYNQLKTAPNYVEPVEGKPNEEHNYPGDKVYNNECHVGLEHVRPGYNTKIGFANNMAGVPMNCMPAFLACVNAK
jgi:hypothetical protein